MNYKLAFVYNLLKIFLSNKPSKSTINLNKTIINEKLYTIDREKQAALLFNKSPNKYPMGMK